MQPDNGTFNLTLCYQNQWYSYPELLDIKTFPESVIAIPAKDCLQTILAMLIAYNRQQMIFPVADEWVQRTGVIEHQLADLQSAKDPVKKIALAIATSGTQSEPAIALISFGNILAHWQSFIQSVPLQDSSLWLNCLPLEHIAGAMIVYRCGLSHSAMLLHCGFSARDVWRDMNQYPVSHISLVPAMLAQLLEIQDGKLPEHLKYVLVGGDRLSPALHQQALERGWPIVISYGMTEACSTIALGQKVEQLRPLKGFDLRTDNEHNLFIKGDMVISRYLTGREENFKDGWYKTSDRVLLNHKWLHVLGRNDFMIISGGENISPEFIEEQLQNAPMIQAVAVGTIEHETWGHSVVALVVGDAESFKQWLDKHIQSTWRPRHIIPVEEIPVSRLGKIDRSRVKSIINRHVPVLVKLSAMN